MPQTFYVAQDEEILSIISRLRSSALLENVFVVPKRALILQSIVNLRLLAREAEKLGKSVVIVTQDAEGRMLVEKAGLPSRTYSEDMRTREEKTHIIGSDVTQKESVESAKISLLDESRLGSPDFFSESKAVETPTLATAPVNNIPSRPEMSRFTNGGDLKLQVRDNTPKRLTALPSMSKPISNSNQTKERFPSGQEHIGIHTTPMSSGSPSSINGEYFLSSQRMPEGARTQEGRIKRFFGDRDYKPVTAEISQKSEKTKEAHIGRGGSGWFFFFAILSLLSIVGIALFLFLPKAEIVITPNSSSPSIALSFEGTLESSDMAANSVPTRLVEYEEEISVSTEATGVSAEGSSKARGIVILYNEYGTEPQPLVATTRLATDDGKIFRLVKAVTVPGMTEIDGKKEPGAIEVEVIADQAGESYNLDEATFTIPGFQGGPKYEKFFGKNKGALAGGSDGGSNLGMKTVTTSDIERAEEKAREEFRKRFEEKLLAERNNEENFVLDSANIAMLGTATAPSPGVAAVSFEYRAKYRGQIFVFSEKAVKERAAQMLESKVKAQGLIPKPEHITVSYTEAVPDYDKGTIFIKASIFSKIVANIDAEAIKNDFLGKRGDEIKAVLDNHQEIKKIEVNFKPEFFSSAIPTDRNRVSIVIQPE